jgi:hypothetical protein
VVFDGAGHMPHHDDPERFAGTLIDFCTGTDPARLETDHWRPLLSEEAPAPTSAPD